MRAHLNTICKFLIRLYLPILSGLNQHGEYAKGNPLRFLTLSLLTSRLHKTHPRGLFPYVPIVPNHDSGTTVWQWYESFHYLDSLGIARSLELEYSIDIN